MRKGIYSSIKSQKLPRSTSEFLEAIVNSYSKVDSRYKVASLEYNYMFLVYLEICVCYLKHVYLCSAL